MRARYRFVVLPAACILLLAGCARRAPDEGRSGMVVTGDSIATAVGLSILERGGNAVDAAVAAAFALAVTFPEAGNIGGGGFVLVRLPDGTARSIDFRETAPRRSEPGMYDADPAASVDGCLAAGVPGTVAGLLAAAESFGSLPREELLRPAITLAAEGIPVSDYLAGRLLEYRDALSPHPSTRRIFFNGDSTLPARAMLVQADLAGTLGRIADSGMAGFYAGRTAGLIAGQMTSCGGIIDEADLAGYRAVERPVLRGRYRGYDIEAMGPPSSGGICILQALALLERFELGPGGPRDPRAVHLVAEAMKRAFSMRAAYLGDPDFVDVPAAELLRPERLRGTPMDIDTALASPAPGLDRFPRLPVEGTETTHLSVVDRNGMAVALTTTINDLFGNKVVVDGAGFFMNDEMDDFVTAPGRPNLYGLLGGPENAIAPGKRPLSSMSPTIVSKEGNTVLVLGARGGSRIITSVLQAIVNTVDFGLPPREAVAAPRYHHQWLPDTLLHEAGAFHPETAAELERKGHHLREIPWSVGVIGAISIDPATGLLVGVPDRRGSGAAAGF
jgi:gamma-glutamyltranspeptidase/glutathione hydrolase